MAADCEAAVREAVVSLCAGCASLTNCLVEVICLLDPVPYLQQHANRQFITELAYRYG